MANRRSTKYLVVHCSATRPSQDIGAAEIRKWHTEPPRGWEDIGYQYVIRRNGVVEPGRPVNAVGAHVYGQINRESVGICLVGGTSEDGKRDELNYTNFEWSALETLLRVLLHVYPGSVVRGHNDFTDEKQCPVFDVKKWAAKRGFPI